MFVLLFIEFEFDVYCKGIDYGSFEKVFEYEVVCVYGGCMVFVGDLKDYLICDLIVVLRVLLDV